MNPHGPPLPGIHPFAQPMLPHQIIPESVSCSRGWTTGQKELYTRNQE